MKIFLILIVWFSLTISGFGQTLSNGSYSFRVDDFSEDYYGIVKVSDTTEVFTKGTITIYEMKTNKPIINVESDELALDLHQGKIKSNVHQLPYGEQSIIMYDDFNFDGIKDFAIQDGQNSCYHTPSYKIYLVGCSGFSFSSGFTQLAQNYCGMFDVDYADKKIHTMTKSGCCWHQFSTFIVENNRPKPIKIVEEDGSNAPYYTESTEIWDGEKMVKTTKRTIDFEQNEGIKPVFSFQLEGSNKQVILFNINDRTLNYAILRKDSTVEFSYPVETIYKNPDFTFNAGINKTTVIFKNNTTQYTIYEMIDAKGKEEVGIKVNINGKIIDLKGIVASMKGNLKDIPGIKFDNVY